MVNKKLDISKIVFIGVPLLLMLWGVAFIILAFISRDIMISKYGSILILLTSIPIYGILVTKYASKLGATIDTSEQTEDISTNVFRRHVTKFDLYFAGVLIIAIPLYFIIGNYIFNINEEQLHKYVKWIFLLFICIELLLRKKFSKRTK